MLPNLRRAMARHVVVEQAEGHLRERLDLPDAFVLLRRYARRYDTHVSEVARRLMSEPDARPVIVARLAELAPMRT